MTDRRPLTRVARGLGLAIAAVTAGALWTARPQAQPRPPIAIVGARIVDGSGNEPFTGTIVVSGGRISAVGRQVEPPADAERIDGTGKAVLPGFIDTGLATAVDRSSDAGRRWLGRVLASGVTTAAVEGDASVPSGGPVQPRLVGMPTADADAGGSAPSGGRMLRSGTIAVALGDAAPAAVRAIETARARLALSGLAGEEGAIEPGRLAASGLTPLDVVTAMTGGGAWGLGLQSDRGLLAPGMRADLVIVAGDPSVSLDALAQVERVLLGGVDVDRTALMRPPPEPPAATAAATPSASSKGAAPAPARGRARGAKGAKTAPPPATPAAEPAAAATDTPPATAAATTPDPSPDAAPVAATATPAAPAVAGARLRDALLDDFERGETVSAVGPAWVGSGSDGAGSATTLIMGRVVKGLRDHALLVSARMGGGRDPYARAALKLDADGRPVDVSRFRGLRFDARGEGRYRVIFGSPLWTPVNIPFASIGQNGAGARVPWTGRDVVEVRFEMVRDAGRLGWLELDNVGFY